jgi:hypothetical protein
MGQTPRSAPVYATHNTRDTLSVNRQCNVPAIFASANADHEARGRTLALCEGQADHPAVLSHLDPSSALAAGLLIFALVMVIMFEATNAVATVIYTKSLQPGQAVVLSGVMNFIGVLLGGIAVAYALVELLPAEVLSPPDGGPAIAMLVSLFLAALS